MVNLDGFSDAEDELDDEIDKEIEEELEENEPDLDEAEEDADSVVGKKERVQMINQDIKKLLEERDELERQILDLEDDLEDKRI